MSLVQGKTDILRPEEPFKKTITDYEVMDLPFVLNWYDGGHAVDGERLREVMMYK